MNRIFLTCFLGLLTITNIYAQTLNVVTEALITGVGYSSSAWADYDNDGDLDILICGQEQAGAKTARLYRNNLDSTFTDMLIPFTGVNYSACAWGDVDNDGDPDLVITGGDASGNRTANLYINNNGTFTNANAGLTGVLYGSANWADYNNDGWLDLIISGQNSPTSTSTKIYKNNKGVLSSVTHSVAAITGGTAIWGDYNNDGYKDILINGTDNSNNKICKIYKNNKNGTFTDQLVVGLSGVSFGATSWADYDQDGDLDIAIAGTDAFNNKICKIYKNVGGNAFTDLFATTTGVAAASMAWGDYENDGDLDLLVTGNSNSGQTTIIYKNNSGTFSNSGLSFTGLFSGSVSWGDFDKDNDLDLLLTGFSSGGNFATLFRNKATTANTAPTVPANTGDFTSEDTARLAWDNSTDMQSASAGLTYNVYISTTKTEVNTTSPLANTANGYRKIATVGNTDLKNGFEIRGLVQGKYYWTVQSIDNSFIGSAFAPLDSFVICRKFNLGKDTAICYKDSIKLKVFTTPGDVVNWYSTQNPVIDMNKDSIKIEITMNDTIWAQKINTVIGCTAIYDTIIALTNPPSTLDASADRFICFGDTTKLGGLPTATGGFLTYQYAWSPKGSLTDSTLANPIAQPDTNTKYTLIVRSGTCKPDTAYVTISLNVLPIVVTNRDTTIGAGEILPLEASGAVTYKWSPSTGLTNTHISNPSAEPLENIIYVVTGTDANGCKDKDTVNVFVKNDLFIPDLFSPDDNGVNDAFKIFGAGIKEIDFKIYNRYGEVIYESSDIDELLRKGWDGTYKGVAQSTGTYLWTMKGSTYGGDELMYKGKKTGTLVLKR